MCDCIVGLRPRIIIRILHFYPFFFLSVFHMLTFEICVRVFSRTIQAGNFNLVYIWTMSCCIVRLSVRLIAFDFSLYLSIFLGVVGWCDIAG